MQIKELRRHGPHRHKFKSETKLTAWCTSATCCTIYKSGKRKEVLRVIKTVGEHCDWCPDCKHALFWERI